MSYGGPRLRSFLLAVAAFAGCVSAASDARVPVEQSLASEKLHISGVRDAGKVNDFLYRGAQPNDKARRIHRGLPDCVRWLDARASHPRNARFSLQLILAPGNDEVCPRISIATGEFAGIGVISACAGWRGKRSGRRVKGLGKPSVTKGGYPTIRHPLQTPRPFRV